MAVAEQLEQAINTLLNNYVSSKSAALAGVLTPIAITAVTVYILLMGFAIMRGEANDSLHTFLWKSAKIAFIAGIALSVGEYQGTAILMMQGIQEGFTQAMGGVATIGQLIDNMAQPYDALGQALWSQATTGFWPNFSLIAAACFVAIAQATLFIIGLGMYLLAKVALALVLAVGPAFILCAMFPGTQKYTESWIGQVLNFVMLNVLVAASISMLTDFASQYAGHMQGQINSANVLLDALALVLCSCALAVVMLNLNTLASALSGGASISGIGREVGRAMMARGVSKEPKQPAGEQPGGGTITPASGSPASGGGASTTRSSAAGGASNEPLYQRNVIDNIKQSSTT